MSSEQNRRSICQSFPDAEPALLFDLLDSVGGDLRAAVSNAEVLLGPPRPIAPPSVRNHDALPRPSESVTEPPSPALVVSSVPIAGAQPRSSVRVTVSLAPLQQLQGVLVDVPVPYLEELLLRFHNNVAECADDYFANGIITADEVQPAPQQLVVAPAVDSSAAAAALAAPLPLDSQEATPAAHANNASANPVEEHLATMFPLIPRSIIADTVEQANGDLNSAMDRILSGWADPGEAAPPVPLPPPTHCTNDIESQQRSTTENLVEKLRAEFPIFGAKMIRKAVRHSARNDLTDDELETTVRKHLQQKERARDHFYSHDGVAGNGNAFKNEEEDNQAPPPCYKAALASSVPPMLPQARAPHSAAAFPATGALPTLAQPSTSTQFHIFWDYDNRQTSQESVGLLSKVKEYFQLHAIPPTSRQQNSVFVEIFLTVNSRINVYQINSLRDLGGKIVTCSSKPGDADRQIMRAVRDLLTWGLDPSLHHIVIMSSDKDFTDCAESIRRAGFTAWCVHEAQHYGHERILKSMYDKCVHLDEVNRRTN